MGSLGRELEAAVDWAMDRLTSTLPWLLELLLALLGLLVALVLLPLWLPRLVWRTLARMWKGGAR